MRHHPPRRIASVPPGPWASRVESEGGRPIADFYGDVADEATDYAGEYVARDALLAAKDQEIERLRYRVRRLTTALRPFVRECDRVIRSLAKVPCKPDVPRPYIVIQIMRDDHRAAKAALLGSPRAGEGQHG